MDIGGLSVDKIKEQISKYEQEIKDLKEKAVKATGDARAKLEVQISLLKARIADAKAKLEELKGKGKDILGKFKK
jgi:phage shock protein A